MSASGTMVMKGFMWISQFLLDAVRVTPSEL
jgi:hypothetical protein